MPFNTNNNQDLIGQYLGGNKDQQSVEQSMRRTDLKNELQFRNQQQSIFQRFYNDSHANPFNPNYGLAAQDPALKYSIPQYSARRTYENMQINQGLLTPQQAAVQRQWDEDLAHMYMSGHQPSFLDLQEMYTPEYSENAWNKYVVQEEAFDQYVATQNHMSGDAISVDEQGNLDIAEGVWKELKFAPAPLLEEYYNSLDYKSKYMLDMDGIHTSEDFASKVGEYRQQNLRFQPEKKDPVNSHLWNMTVGAASGFAHALWALPKAVVDLGSLAAGTVEQVLTGKEGTAQQRMMEADNVVSGGDRAIDWVVDKADEFASYNPNDKWSSFGEGMGSFAGFMGKSMAVTYGSGGQKAANEIMFGVQNATASNATKYATRIAELEALNVEEQMAISKLTSGSSITTEELKAAEERLMAKKPNKKIANEAIVKEATNAKRTQLTEEFAAKRKAITSGATTAAEDAAVSGAMSASEEAATKDAAQSAIENVTAKQAEEIIASKEAAIKSAKNFKGGVNNASIKANSHIITQSTEQEFVNNTVKATEAMTRQRLAAAEKTYSEKEINRIVSRASRDAELAARDVYNQALKYKKIPRSEKHLMQQISKEDLGNLDDKLSILKRTAPRFFQTPGFTRAQRNVTRMIAMESASNTAVEATKRGDGLAETLLRSTMSYGMGNWIWGKVNNGNTILNGMISENAEAKVYKSMSMAYLKQNAVASTKMMLEMKSAGALDQIALQAWQQSYKLDENGKVMYDENGRPIIVREDLGETLGRISKETFFSKEAFKDGLVNIITGMGWNVLHKTGSEFMSDKELKKSSFKVEELMEEKFGKDTWDGIKSLAAANTEGWSDMKPHVQTDIALNYAMSVMGGKVSEIAMKVKIEDHSFQQAMQARGYVTALADDLLRDVASSREFLVRYSEDARSWTEQDMAKAILDIGFPVDNATQARQAGYIGKDAFIFHMYTHGQFDRWMKESNVNPKVVRQLASTNGGRVQQFMEKAEGKAGQSVTIDEMYEQITSDINSKQMQKGRLEKQLEEAENGVGEQMSERDRNLLDVKLNERKMLKEQIKLNEKRTSKEKSATNVNKNTIKELASTKEIMQGDLKMTENEIELLLKKVVTDPGKINSIEKKIAQIEDELANLKKDKAESEKNYSYIDKRIAKEQSVVDDLIKQRNKLEKENEKLSKREDGEEISAANQKKIANNKRLIAELENKIFDSYRIISEMTPTEFDRIMKEYVEQVVDLFNANESTILQVMKSHKVTIDDINRMHSAGVDMTPAITAYAKAMDAIATKVKGASVPKLKEMWINKEISEKILDELVSSKRIDLSTKEQAIAAIPKSEPVKELSKDSQAVIEVKAFLEKPEVVNTKKVIKKYAGKETLSAVEAAELDSALRVISKSLSATQDSIWSKGDLTEYNKSATKSEFENLVKLVDEAKKKVTVEKQTSTTSKTSKRRQVIEGMYNSMVEQGIDSFYLQEPTYDSKGNATNLGLVSQSRLKDLLDKMDKGEEIDWSKNWDSDLSPEVVFFDPNQDKTLANFLRSDERKEIRNEKGEVTRPAMNYYEWVKSKFGNTSKQIPEKPYESETKVIDHVKNEDATVNTNDANTKASLAKNLEASQKAKNDNFISKTESGKIDTEDIDTTGKKAVASDTSAKQIELSIKNLERGLDKLRELKNKGTKELTDKSGKVRSIDDLIKEIEEQIKDKKKEICQL